MAKILLLFTFLCISLSSYSQFATGGTGLYQRQIYWLPWYTTEDNGKTGLVEIQIDGNSPISYTNNNFSSNILPEMRSDTVTSTKKYYYTWKINENMRVKGTVYNVKRVANRSNTQKAVFATETYNSYDSSGLQRMYTGLKDKHIGIGVKDGTLKFDIDLVFEMIKPGTTVWAPIDNPEDHGLVFADSESIDGAGEYISAMVDQSTSWYLIDYAKTPAPSTPGGTFEGTAYQICYDTASNLKKVTLNNPNTGNRQQGATAVMFAKGVNTIKNLELKGSGYTYVSIGYFINHDPSNDRGYDNAMHFQEIFTAGNNDGGSYRDVNGCVNYNAITNNEVSIPGAKLTTNAFFGNAPNVEDPYNDSLSNLDALTQASLIKENDGTSTLRYNIKFTNNYNVPAFIYAFADTSKNNVFEHIESAYHLVPKSSRSQEYDTFYYFKVEPNTVNQSLVLEWPNFKVNNAGTYAIRFRITTDSLIDNAGTVIDERAYGLARNGEVTDRYISVLTEQEFNTALPIRLIDFKAYSTSDGVKVKWITNDESMIDHFNVEKSTNGSDWKVIATVKAHNEAENTYEIVDAQPSAANVYYRLAIIENESKNYSKVIRISNEQKATKVYPNPTTGILHLQGVQDNAVVRIYNTLGAYVGNAVVQKETINIASLEKGSYVLYINNDQKVQIIKH